MAAVQATAANDRYPLRQTRRQHERGFEFGPESVSVARRAPLVKRSLQHPNNQVLAACARRITRRARYPLLRLTLEPQPLGFLVGIRSWTHWLSLDRERLYVFESCSAH